MICPFHAYKFDLETGKPVGNDCEALQSYHSRAVRRWQSPAPSPLREGMTNDEARMTK